MNAPVTLYLADDHQIVVDGLKLLISSEESIKIVGYANNGDDARTDIIAKRPDLALIDLRMPGLNGLDLIITLRKVVKDTKFVILSMHDDVRHIKDAMNHGASGYLLKNAGKSELMKCLSVVLSGGTYFPDLRKNESNVNKSLFTPRELEILKLILEECTTMEIASRLSLSTLTVDTHRKNINRKTNTKTPLGIIKFLEENQLKL